MALESTIAHKSTHAAGGADALTPADIGAARVMSRSAFQDPDPAQGVVDQAIQLWDTVNDAPALLISDGNVSFGPYTENSNVAANFRTAIGAAASTDPTITGTVTINSLIGATADLYLGQNGKVGIGTETPTERLEVAGKVKISNQDGELRVVQGTAYDAVEYVAVKSYGIESGWNNSSLSFEEQALRSNGTIVLNWYDANISVGERTLKNLGRPEEANDAVRKTDLDARAPLIYFLEILQCPEANFNTIYTFAGIDEQRPKYLSATGESLLYTSDGWALKNSAGQIKYNTDDTGFDMSFLTDDWRRIAVPQSIPVKITVKPASFTSACAELNRFQLFIPKAPVSGTYALRSVNGVVSWVAA